MKKSEALRILGLSDGATDEEVKAAHRKKVVANHPDNFARDSVEYAKAEERTKLINEARDVLLSRKWEPEYTRRGGYGNPYAGPYSPYSGYPGPGGGGHPDNPFEGWPFGQGQNTYVWTSWGEADGKGGTYNPFAQQQPAKTPEELKAEAKKGLQTEIAVTAAKLACLTALGFFKLLPIGLFLYVVVSFVYALWKRLGRCLLSFLVPLAFVFAPLIASLAPRAAALVIPFALLTVLAFVFDVKNIVVKAKAYRAL